MNEDTDGWRRLDARMLLVHPLETLIRFLPALLAVVIFRSGSDGNDRWELYAVPLIVAFGVLRWLTTRYRIADGQIELRRGLFTKQTTTARLDKVRTIDLTARVYHRLLGLAKVEVSTAGGHHDRLVLDSLGVDAGRRLRAELLHRLDPAVTGLPAPTGAPVAVDEVPRDAPPPVDDELLLRLDPTWIRYAPLTVTGLASAAAIVGFATQGFSRFSQERSVFRDGASLVSRLVVVGRRAAPARRRVAARGRRLRPDLLGLPPDPQPARHPAHAPRPADEPRDEHRRRPRARHPARRAARAPARRSPPAQGRHLGPPARAGRLRLAVPARAGRRRHATRPAHPARRGRRDGAAHAARPGRPAAPADPRGRAGHTRRRGPRRRSAPLGLARLAARPRAAAPRRRGRAGSGPLPRPGPRRDPRPPRVAPRLARPAAHRARPRRHHRLEGRAVVLPATRRASRRSSPPRPPAPSTTTSSTCPLEQAYAVLAQVSPDLLAEFA